MIVLSELKKFSKDREICEVRKLLNQLSSEKPRKLSFLGTNRLLEQITQNPDNIVLIARDLSPKDKIVGMATLVCVPKLSGTMGHIEDVVVDAEHRGKGLGEKLVRELLKLARDKKLKYIELTSNPTRTEANALYQKLGFERRETNVYRMKLTRSEEK